MRSRLPTKREIDFDYKSLSSIPKDSLFKLFEDGEQWFVPEWNRDEYFKWEGWRAFDTTEPGCMKAYFIALSFALQITSPITSDTILEIHRLATSGVSKKNRFEDKFASGVFRQEHTNFDVPKKHITVNGLNEFLLNYYTRSKLTSTISVCNGKRILWSIQKLENENQSLDQASVIYSKLGDGKELRYESKNRSFEEFKEEINQILSKYYLSLSNCKSRDEILETIITCIKALEILHPFNDGNGRVFVNVLLQVFLLQNGFPPAIFFQPNVFDFYSTKELIDIVKDAMKHTLFTIKNPHKTLFNYNTDTMSDEDRKELLALTGPLNKVIEEKLHSLDIIQKEYEDYIQDMNSYLDSAWNGKIRIHQACVLGEESFLSIEQIENHSSEKAPEHTSPLYRGLTPLQVAISVRQLDVVRHMLKMDPSLICDDERVYNQLKFLFNLNLKINFDDFLSDCIKGITDLSKRMELLAKAKSSPVTEVYNIFHSEIAEPFSSVKKSQENGIVGAETSKNDAKEFDNENTPLISRETYDENNEPQKQNIKFQQSSITTASTDTTSTTTLTSSNNFDRQYNSIEPILLEETPSPLPPSSSVNLTKTTSDLEHQAQPTKILPTTQSPKVGTTSSATISSQNNLLVTTDIAIKCVVFDWDNTLSHQSELGNAERTLAFPDETKQVFKTLSALGIDIIISSQQTDTKAIQDCLEKEGIKNITIRGRTPTEKITKDIVLAEYHARNSHLSKKEIMLVDDSKTACKTAKESGFKAVLVKDAANGLNITTPDHLFKVLQQVQLNIAEAEAGIAKYQARNGSHLNIFQKLFDSTRGVNRANIYSHLLKTQTPTPFRRSSVF